jgi:hypothetical protein
VSEHDTGDADEARALMATIDEAGLGPATVSLVRHPDGVEVVMVDLDPASPTKAATLARWLGFITLDTAIAGHFRGTDTALCLALRGHMFGGLVVVVATFDEATEPAQAALIRAELADQNIPRLLAGLAAAEALGNVHP